MNKYTSTYYPRRARWYGRIFYWGTAIRNRIAMDRIRMPNEMTVGGLIGSFVIPGLAVYLRGPRLWGQAALLACAFLFLFFIVWLGYPFGNYALGMLLSIHATGFVYYCGPYLLEKEFMFRIGFTIAVLIALGLMIYTPIRGAIQNHWLTPLRVKNHVVIVEKFASARGIKPGDWVMYSLNEASTGDAHGEGGAVWVREGVGWGPVLAMAGDRVTFSTNSFAVNGIEQPHRLHMPTSGELVIPEKQWFIWPDLGISGHGNAGEANISAVMLSLATVPESQFVGKPFKRWFWREQVLP
ncbi:MAG TPA: hypothetical protein VII37_05265 [Candidatus Acidoferrum sp.]